MLLGVQSSEMREEKRRKKEEIAEDYCFVCKDGGLLLVCDYKDCLKAYHPQCVGKDNSFIDTKRHYSCDWHSCFLCHKRSHFRCFVCPRSVCRACIENSEFVCTREGKGFCAHCLKLAKLIEENADVDSDGGKVDFKDTETYEFLFLDYWVIVKEKESITLEEICNASALLKNNQNYESGFDLYKDPEEEDVISAGDDIEIYKDDGISFLEKPRGSHGRKMMTLKKSGSLKREFIGWASKELAEFLTSIGKDIEKPLTQLEVSDIIKEYVRSNNLHHPNKKKKAIICDARLYSIFKKKTLNRRKVEELLERHFSDYQESEDDFLFGAEEDNYATTNKRQKGSDLDFTDHGLKRNGYKKKVSGTPKSCYAAVVSKNIKKVYLKQSLVKKLLKTPETFESKVVDSFVRIKCDRMDIYIPRNSHQLVQVIGINKGSETYKIGGTSTDIIFRVSDVLKDIRILMLSDDDFTEEECEDLRQRVKDGLLKRPLLVDLEKKARNLHADITNHWIETEILVLQNQIDRANEKGWRRELYEFMERKQLLTTESERARLLNELPEVVADEAVEPKDATDSPVQGELEGQEAVSSETAVERVDKGSTFNRMISNFLSESGVAWNEKSSIGEVKGEEQPLNEDRQSDGVEAASSKGLIESELNEVEQLLNEEKQSNAERTIIDIDNSDEDVNNIRITNETPVIELDDDDVDDHTVSDEKPVSVYVDDLCEIWHYRDPFGKVHGPFMMKYLRRWKERNYFKDDFKVWKTGQSEEEAVLLIDALNQSVFAS
ncbi:hypothetical protein QJS04_geneDACA009940 [Acorus gramineus]|uniref:Uncharacterized protein n=1 Tax=Acorus gramineus TaxID=55184 RepID=A0AAV9BGT3_ACOGR|nr:hypothetical protein QJS04_geneDACA009940 [Acorus gramineus]